MLFHQTELPRRLRILHSSSAQADTLRYYWLSSQPPPMLT
jgi:hypothetical protein